MRDSGLDLAFDDIQQALAGAVGQLCSEHCRDADLRAVSGQFPEALWKQIAELGVLALASPEGEGGALELVAVLEALGEAAFPGPLAATLFAVQLLGGTERRALANGERIVSVGAQGLFPFAARADLFLEVEGARVFRVEPEARLEAVETLGGEPWGRLRCRRVAELREPERAFALHDLALAAFLSSLGLRLVRDTALHASARKQFGRPIGEFQAVAHPLADRLIQLQAAQLLARRAACCCDELARNGNAPQGGAAALLELRCAAGAARLSARRAALDAAHVCHQLFGAVGITLEGPVFERSRRILQLASALPGDAAARAALEQSLAALETPERPDAAPPPRSAP